ncbi:hypothetical protein BGZ81_004861, partial [Podila clonocystis]
MDLTTAVLYFDGAQCEEKAKTHQKRQDTRTKAIDAADKKVSAFTDRVASGARIRKHHFTNVDKQLKNAFRWETEARDGLILFLESRGWTVVKCDTEADPKIAEDTTDGDIVISGDSDLLIYGRVKV